MTKTQEEEGSSAMLLSIMNGDDSPTCKFSQNDELIIHQYEAEEEAPDSDAMLVRAILDGDDSPPITTVFVDANANTEVSDDCKSNTSNISKQSPTKENTATCTGINNSNSKKYKKQKVIRNKYKTVQEFKYQNHSLYLSASQIAAMVGLNPYTNIPKLFMDLVYQGYNGKQLLDHDAKLLNISIISEEESIKQIASKGGKNLQKVLNDSLQIAKGKRSVQSIQNASEVKKDIIKKIQDHKHKLTPGEIKILMDGMRHNVNTGYGKFHEDNALDLYEKQCGWEVRERNAERKCWKFMKADDLNSSDQDLLKTVVPIDLVESVRWDGTITSSRVKGNEVENKENNTCASVVNTALQDAGESLAKAIEVHSSQENDEQRNRNNRHNLLQEPPFFTINGVVDGIRDELYHVPSVSSVKDGSGITNYDLHPQHMDMKYSDDDEWSLREVVVECKHRMNKVFNPPPIYDQIQAVIYAFMYGTSESEIVQVVRNGNKDTSINDSSISGRIKLQNDENESKSIAKYEDDDKEKKNLNRTKLSSSSIQITSYRVSLDEPIMQHRQNWNTTILPRLRSFVDAVYNVRCNDDKRYRLIQAATLASSSGNEYEWWKIVHDECPWLQQCDTAFSRAGKKC